MTLARWLLLTVLVLLLFGIGIARCFSDSRSDTETRGRWRVDTFVETMSSFGHGPHYYDHLFLDNQRVAAESELDSCVLEPEFEPRTVLCCESIPEGKGRRLVVYAAQSGKGKMGARSLGGMWIRGAMSYCEMSKRPTQPDDARWVEGKFHFVRTIENPGYKQQQQDVDFDPKTGQVTSVPRPEPTPP